MRERADLARLRGTVTQRFDAAAGTLVIQAVTPTSRRAGLRGDREQGDVFRMIERDDQLLSVRIAPGDLDVGEVVDVFGQPAAPCFDADTLISFGVGGI